MLRHPIRCLATATALVTLTACGAGGGESGQSTSLDTIPPQAGQVSDGTGADIDTQASTTEISANWTGFLDNSGTITEYEWAIGTTMGGTEVQTWTSNDDATVATNSAVVLQEGMTYFCSVRAYDPAGNVSQVASSNGVQIENSQGGGSQGGGGGSSSVVLASSISRHGITWQFAEPCSVGQFANGDWWVVGPVDIVSISPPSQNVGGRVINGSMVNPGQNEIQNAEHGYDSELFGNYAGDRYKEYLNVAWGVTPSSPLQLGPGNSLISTISWTDPNPPPSGSHADLKTAAVLTILPEEAEEGDFRPPYSGTDKTIRFNESDLDYSALANLNTASDQPYFQETADRFERVWLDHCSSWTSRYMHPVDNMPDYGRDFTSLYSTGALLVHLNKSNEFKRNLLVRMTQIGIDFFGNAQNGGVWTGVGGQCSGRKFPILFAGRVLNDTQMLSLGTTHPSAYYGPNHPNNSGHFGEDCQTFYVEETSPGTYNWGHGNYNSSHNGIAEWGNAHTQFPQNDDSDWFGDPYRRCCTANAWVGQTLSARIMGLQSAWNHPAYFDYMDIFMATETPGEWTRAWNSWQGRMWDLHRSSY